LDPFFVLVVKDFRFPSVPLSPRLTSSVLFHHGLAFFEIEARIPIFLILTLSLFSFFSPLQIRDFQGNSCRPVNGCASPFCEFTILGVSCNLRLGSSSALRASLFLSPEFSLFSDSRIDLSPLAHPSEMTRRSQ